MKKLRWLRSVAFILVLCMAVLGVARIYSQPKYFNTRFINTFEEMPDNTVDGVFIGSSVIAHGWVSAVAWEKYGLAGYQFGTSVQPFGSIPGFIEYAEKNHDLKFVVIDLHSLRKQSLFTGLLPSKVQEAYLNIPDISVRYSMLLDILDYAERAYEFYGEPDQELLDRNSLKLYWPLLEFHNRWIDGLEKADFTNVKNTYLGANDRKDTAFRIMDMTKYAKYIDFKGEYELDDFQKNELDLLFEYLDGKDYKVLFINTPSFRAGTVQKELSGLLKYCADKGYNTIDFATRDMLKATGLNIKTDFADAGHVNLLGAEKVTDYLCRYLIDNDYGYTDRRGQDGYDIWDEGTENYNKFFVAGWRAKGVKVAAR